LVTLEGIVEDIIYTNEENGYIVCDIRCTKDVVTVVGYMPFISVGETIKVTGKWTTHPDYGEQLKAEYYEKVLPEEADEIEKYLASGVIKGIGPATARKIVERFGEKTFDIILSKPELLSEIKGISLDKALKIGEAFAKQRELKSVVTFFQEYGISPALSIKIYRAFGDKTIDEIKANPYRLADEAFGIGFKTADKIAMRLGVDLFSKLRLCSGIKYALSLAASNGHTYLPEDKLKEYASRLLGVGVESIEDALVSLLFTNEVCMEKKEGVNNIYLYSLHLAENEVCKRLLELSSVKFRDDICDFDSKIERLQAEEGITLAEMQKIAVREAMTNGVLVITGGPGTGKTTIIKSIIKLLNKEGYSIVLAAPTGRAAKRMTETTGFEAKTIHRLLEIGYVGADNRLVFQKNENDPLDADVIIIDEMSMVDILLMHHLLKAVPQGARLILVGDVNQLPSVGAGNVLKDIISSGIIKTVKLTEIFRQAEESMIIVNAHRINRGEPPLINTGGKDFFFIQRNTLDSIVKTVVELCSKRLPDAYGYDPMKHIQVLTPMRKGPAGVLNLNVELQKALNPAGRNKAEKSFRDFVIRVGDRVMQIRNNYSLRWRKINSDDEEGMGVFNGDTGIVHEIDPDEHRLTVLFDDEKIVDYDFVALDEIEPAYAITIHKSQGSEFPAVILPIFPGPEILLTRNLLYTAVTRAKDIVVIVGMEDVLFHMVSNERETLRYSSLSSKLGSFFSRLEGLLGRQGEDVFRMPREDSSFP